jgi:hypothetical protein
MSTATIRAARRRRQLITYSWIVGLTAGTVALIHWEQTALLYILATVGVTVLLVVVGKADLAHSDTMSSQSSATDRTGSSSTAGRRV